MTSANKLKEPELESCPVELPDETVGLTDTARLQPCENLHRGHSKTAQTPDHRNHEMVMCVAQLRVICRQ
jgi:hypothetical protein